VPYTVPLVDLDEGVRMVAAIEGVEPEEMKLGMPVQVVFEDVTAEITLPRFRKAS
jgi:uncharacterized OB-fold protein